MRGIRLAPATVLRYEKLARRFPGQRARSGELAYLPGAEVTGFLPGGCARASITRFGSSRTRVSWPDHVAIASATCPANGHDASISNSHRPSSEDTLSGRHARTIPLMTRWIQAKTRRPAIIL